MADWLDHQIAATDLTTVVLFVVVIVLLIVFSQGQKP